jgi:pantoate--beta-alanine ligase
VVGKLQISQPELVTDPAAIHALVQAERERGKTIGLVATMGALHDGHLSLVEIAAAQCDVTVVTIFVNPTQFGDAGDFDRYPRDLRADLDRLTNSGSNFVFAPSNDQIYHQDHASSIEIGYLAETLEGRYRPGHFSGVATIVVKLFQMIPADVAFFGRKDYQQLKVIERVVSDLNIPITVYACPTVRENDGLALSSRNVFLQREHRKQAPCLWESLQLAQELINQGETDAQIIVAKMREKISASKDMRIDYVVLADPETLKGVTTVAGRVVALVAGRVGDTRLIDNQMMAPAP